MLYEMGQKPTQFQIKEGEEAYNVKDGVKYTKDKWGNIIMVGETPETPLVLLNSWVDYGGSWSMSPANYRKVGSVVHLEGLIKNGTANNAVIAILPEGFRPSTYIIVPAITSGEIACRISIYSTGTVIASASYTSTGWLSLSGISFTVI